MTIGFTGTRQGLTFNQYRAVVKILGEKKPDMVIHGDALGADTEFHNICLSLKKGLTTTNSLPKIKLCPATIQRAYNENYDIIMPAKEPLDRNKDIVNECDYLVACPATEQEVLRSGTWSTIRYAKKVGKIVFLIKPSGEVT